MFGQAHAGAGGLTMSDLGGATRLVASIHASYGLGGKIAFLSPSADALDLLKDKDFAAKVEDHLGTLYVRATKFVRTHRELIEMLAHRLVDERVIDGAGLRRLIAASVAPSLAEGRPAPTKGGRHG